MRQSGQYVYSPDELTIGWDASAQSLASVDRDGGAARTSLSEAEWLLFSEGDMSAAAAMLDRLLAEPDGLPVTILPMRKQLATFEPYVLYLRGLAAELSGRPNQAVQAYWTLWNSYPIHPFSAIICTSRLVQLEEQPS